VEHYRRIGIGSQVRKLVLPFRLARSGAFVDDRESLAGCGLAESAVEADEGHTARLVPCHLDRGR
jgi:hypothetical protein